MNNSDTNNYLIIDWGTSNFRAFLMDKNHQLIKTKQKNMGLLQVKDGNFPFALKQILDNWITDYHELPIYMAGMVGSANGWKNVDYVPTPVNSSLLSKNLTTFPLPWGSMATIVPGVKHRLENSSFDVMRGEEVQVLGLNSLVKQEVDIAVLPGTHSKHITIQNNQITQLKTFMTGELFSIICEHSILGKNLQKQQKSDDAFLQGVTQSQSGEITNLLFLARTHLLFENINSSHIHEFISGLLIGQELKGLLKQNVIFVGGENLSERYLLASNALNINACTVDGDQCFLAGMRQIIPSL